VQHENQGRAKATGFIISHLEVAHRLVPGLESLPSRTSQKDEIDLIAIYSSLMKDK